MCVRGPLYFSDLKSNIFFCHDFIYIRKCWCLFMLGLVDIEQWFTHIPFYSFHSTVIFLLLLEGVENCIKCCYKWYFCILRMSYCQIHSNSFFFKINTLGRLYKIEVTLTSITILIWVNHLNTLTISLPVNEKYKVYGVIKCIL